MKSAAAIVDAYLAEPPDGRRETVSARDPDGFIALYQRAREQ